MPQPELYQCYSIEEVISFFGSRSEAQSLCNGQWLIFPKAVICLTSIGAAPGSSYFQNGSYFCWVADQPYCVSDERWSHFVPAPVVGSTGKQYAIRLFVRSPESAGYLYLGELEPSYMQQAPGRESHGMARFELKPAIPSALWLKFGGLQLGNLDFVPVDRALDRLRSRTTVEDRLGVLQQLVDYWHGPIEPDDGMSDAELAGVALPLPLRWWYRWAGRRTEVMSG